MSSQHGWTVYTGGLIELKFKEGFEKPNFLNAKGPDPVWTTTQPTVRGWYWVRTATHPAPRIVWVSAEKGLFWPAVDFDGNPVAPKTAEWFGPLTPPEN